MLARWLLEVLKTCFISEAKIVVIFDAQNCDFGGLVPAFWHSWVPFWYLGGTLGDRGSSRKDMWGLESKFHWFWYDFAAPFWEQFGQRGLLFCFFSGLVSRPLFVAFFMSKSRCLGLLNKVFVQKVLQKPTFRRNSILVILSSIFHVFLGVLGNSFYDFWCHGSRLGILWFFRTTWRDPCVEATYIEYAKMLFCRPLTKNH